MKSEDFAMQQLEKARRIKAQEPLEGEGAKPTTKFMIAADAPLVMTKACELMIKELSIRAWRHTDNNRRKTLQRADVHAAVGESEIFDFLIDLVPRVTPSDSMRVNVGGGQEAAAAAAATATGPEVSPPTGSDQQQSAGMAAAHASPQHQHPQLDLETASLLMGPDFTHQLQHPQQFFHVNNPTAGNTDETENASAPEEEEEQQQQQHDDQSDSAHLWGEKPTAG